ncbi:MAG TPA: sigma-70 family RNA polymerase sigma factor [Mycobacteriales bacterium]|nr:sigma-70 family RNA polymerase sigma factor [Mycobacteriales bacterium]
MDDETAVKGSSEELVAALRAGDEECFQWLVHRYSPGMLRVAAAHVPTREIAEEVVQDTWVAVLRGLDGFEGRASLKTWLFQILLNIARKRGVRERRTVPFSDVFREPDSGPTVDPGRFLPDDHSDWPHHWASFPQRWPKSSPEPELLASEMRTRLSAALRELPERHRCVISLRDVQGYDADDVCQILEISSGNQRVLLHRARARMRAVLEDYYTRESL